jgi:hypothetical protein
MIVIYVAALSESALNSAHFAPRNHDNAHHRPFAEARRRPSAHGDPPAADPNRDAYTSQ